MERPRSEDYRIFYVSVPFTGYQSYLCTHSTYDHVCYRKNEGLYRHLRDVAYYTGSTPVLCGRIMLPLRLEKIVSHSSDTPVV